MNFSRRDFINYLKNILGTASVYPFINGQRLFAQDDNEHYFIFVELRGGIHHTVVADFPDPDKIKPLINDQYIMPFSLFPESTGFFDDQIYDNSNFIASLKKGLSNDQEIDPHDLILHQAPHRLNGYFCALPMTDENGKELYYVNGRQRLGSAGLALAEHANNLSVLRGVYMLGNFHGIANKEIYSGSSTDAGPHVAGVLTKLLVENKGLEARPLDNIILNGASYSFGSESQKIVAPIQMSLESLATVAGQNSTTSLDPAKILATAMRNKYGKNYGDHLNGIVGNYIESFANATTIKEGLKNIPASSTEDIYPHLQTCLQLFNSGLSRVATVTVGSSGIGGFGMFDSHEQMYHGDQYDKSYHEVTKINITSIARFISELKRHPLADKVTLVVSSEFGRSNNFAGNGEQDSDGTGAFGNGHYYFNNNYIFYGKNIARGQWLGESDPVTRYPYVCDIDKLNSDDYSKAFQSPLEIVDVDGNPQHGKKIALRNGFTGGQLQHSRVANSGTEVVRNKEHRAIMAKDVVRTIMKIAGLEDKFREYYPGNDYQDAKVIDKLIS